MARAIWDGNISFGLINIPIELRSMQNTKDDVDLNMIDSRDQARIQYKKVNADTGKEVPWKNITKGYKISEDEYLTLDKDALKDMQLKSTQSIELTEFVDLADIPYYYFDKPYVLAPGKKAEKSYLLLYRALESKKKAALGKVTIKTREHLGAIVAEGNALILNLLRFKSDLKPLSAFEFVQDLKGMRIAAKEQKLACDLVDSLSSDWSPEQFKDEYKIALKKYVKSLSKKKSSKKKAKSKKVDETVETKSNVINITELLEKSLKINKKAK